MSKTTQRVLWVGATVGIFLAMVICGIAFAKGGSFSGGSHVSSPAPAPAPRPAPAPAPRPAPTARPAPRLSSRPARPIARRPIRRPIRRPRSGVVHVHHVYPGGNPNQYQYNPPNHGHKSHLKTILIIVGLIFVVLLILGVFIMLFGANKIRKEFKRA